MYKYVIFLFIVFIVIFVNIEEEKFEGKYIEFGTSIPKKGIMKEWGSAVYSGANAYFKYAKDANLLNNREIIFTAYDDQYEPELTLENVNKLIKRDIFAFFAFVGTPTVKKILPIINKVDIPLIAPFSGASFLRNDNLKNIVNFRSSYSQEIDNIIEYLYNKKKFSSFAVFYQNDYYGQEGFVSLLNALKKKNLKLVGEGAYKRNTLSIRHAYHEIKLAKPQAVIMIGAYKANALFIKTAKKDPLFKNTIFCNVSFGGANEIIKELGRDTDNLLFSEVVPSYDNTSIPVILEYKTLMKKYYPNEPLNFISLEAFLSAKIVIKAIKNTKDPLTRRKFLNEIKRLNYNSLEGVDIKYKNNQLHNKVYLFKYNDSKFVEVNNEN